MRNFKELKVWQKAHQLVLGVYRDSSAFPAEERFGLTAHLRNTALSIPSNISEGCGRETALELARFLGIAAGSVSELDYQVLLAHDFGYLSDDTFHSLTDQIGEVRRMLYRFLQSLEADS